MFSVAPRQSYELRPHQVAAIRAAVAGLMAHDRGQVRMACGTGKTLTAIRLAEALGAEQILILVPNLSLLAQMLGEWQQHSARPFRAVAVCSDSGVADENRGAFAEIPIPVTTNPEVVPSELGGSRPRTVVFATYHSAGVIAAAQTSGAHTFDLILADEAHRTAGHADGLFRLALDAAQIRGAKRVFMTATARTEVGEGGRSMDDEAQYGPVFYDFTFRQAIDAGRLCSYRVIIVGITDEMIRPYLGKGAEILLGSARRTGAEVAAAVAVLKAMRDYDLRRVVSFHSTVQNAAGFARTLPVVARWMGTDYADGLTSGHVNGARTTTQPGTSEDHEQESPDRSPRRPQGPPSRAHRRGQPA